MDRPMRVKAAHMRLARRGRCMTAARTCAERVRHSSLGLACLFAISVEGARSGIEVSQP